MNPKQTMKNYVNALNKKSAEECINLFTKDGMVISPIYGEKKAVVFYKQLFDDSSDAQINLLNVFLSDNKLAGACHFVFNWTLRNGNMVALNLVDVFEFSKNGKIKKLQIIYDAQKAREIVNNMKNKIN
ncbi:hypothetical protein COV16_00820 [Candidatus Woesearchaeota archaeon CG10_big_fil_rev_8_21_14_0_10_34_8]|nr:MAG: hypothetical protein COV16_00820 [Candidatus Woesearchaeota archaeon CG10_big_fil_rev_8_21_14_0_10_34_8]